jgi:Family of unknown function (DUF6284)
MKTKPSAAGRALFALRTGECRPGRDRTSAGHIRRGPGNTDPLLEASSMHAQGTPDRGCSASPEAVTADAGPNAADLAAIEARWPVTAAELALLDAEIRILSAPGQGPSPLDWRRLRHAERQLLAAVARQASRRGELAAGAGAGAS